MVLNEVNLMLLFEHPNIVRALHVINWLHKQQLQSRGSEECASSQGQATTSSPISGPSTNQVGCTCKTCT
jgi:hypothetical protein